MIDPTFAHALPPEPDPTCAALTAKLRADFAAWMADGVTVSAVEAVRDGAAVEVRVRFTVAPWIVARMDAGDLP